MQFVREKACLALTHKAYVHYHQSIICTLTYLEVLNNSVVTSQMYSNGQRKKIEKKNTQSHTFPGGQYLGLKLICS